jgi:hypothetical protein
MHCSANNFGCLKVRYANASIEAGIVRWRLSSLYGSQSAIAHGAAPMRIPPSKILEAALEYDILARERPLGSGKAMTTAGYIAGVRSQFNVLAEGMHREAQLRAFKRPDVLAVGCRMIEGVRLHQAKSKLPHFLRSVTEHKTQRGAPALVNSQTSGVNRVRLISL